MESVLIILSFIGLFFFLIAMRSNINQKLDNINKNLFTIHKAVKQLESKPTEAKEKVISSASLADVPVKNKSLDLSSQLPVTESKQAQEEIKSSEASKVLTDKIKEIDVVLSKAKQDAIVSNQHKSAGESKGKVESHSSTVDFEKKIGENWLNKIGIGILVLGIGFFVKYAIDKNWINELGRLLIGIGTGVLLVVVAHLLRKKYQAFSSVLIGGAVATFYFTISIGYHQYQLFSQVQAFSIMTLVTIFATAMAVWYDRRELAIIGLIGGFTAPFMVAGETNNPLVFFTYVAILNSGMLLLSFFKKWMVLNRMAFGFTKIYLTVWVIMNWQQPEVISDIAILFAIIFFVQFLTMNLVYNSIRKIQFSALEFVHLLAITASFYGVSMYTLKLTGHTDMYGILSISLCTLLAMLTIFFKRVHGTENNLVSLLSAKGITFLTLAILVQFDLHFVTLFWAIEAIILYWLGSRAKMTVLKSASLVVLLISGMTMITHWLRMYQSHEDMLNLVFNSAFLTGIGLAVASGIVFWLIKRDTGSTTFFGADGKIWSMIARYWIFILVYLTFVLEFTYQVQRLQNLQSEIILIWLFHLLFLLGTLIAVNWRGTVLMKQLATLITLAGVLVYACSVNYQVITLRQHLLGESLTNALYDTVYWMHFLNPILIVMILYLGGKLIKRVTSAQSNLSAYLVFSSVTFFYVACCEMDQLAVYNFVDADTDRSAILKNTQIAGYTVLLGIYAFVMMLYGMRKKLRLFRVVALVAFSLAVVKLFAVDIRNISEAGKIIAFISLGIMLLVVSFLYQKLRRLILDGKVGE